MFAVHKLVCALASWAGQMPSVKLVTSALGGVCAFHSHLVPSSSLQPTWPSPAKVTLKVDKALMNKWALGAYENGEDKKELMM